MNATKKPPRSLAWGCTDPDQHVWMLGMCFDSEIEDVRAIVDWLGQVDGWRWRIRMTTESQTFIEGYESSRAEAQAAAIATLKSIALYAKVVR